MIFTSVYPRFHGLDCTHYKQLGRDLLVFKVLQADALSDANLTLLWVHEIKLANQDGES